MESNSTISTSLYLTTEFLDLLGLSWYWANVVFKYINMHKGQKRLLLKTQKKFFDSFHFS